MAVDNERYRLWVASRWRVELEGGEGFRAIHRLLGSAVEYRRRDAFALDGLEERFDFVCCFGILHRVENSLGLLRVLRGRTGGWRHGAGRDPRGRPGRSKGPAIRVPEPGEVYARDEFVYWGFGNAGVQRIARIPGFSRVESLVDVEVDGDPRIIAAGRVEAPGRRSQQPLHKTTISGRYCRSGFVELRGGPALRQSGPGPIGGLAPRAC